MRARTFVIGGAVLGGAALLWRRTTPDPATSPRDVLQAPQVERLYDRLASSYDGLAAVYRLVGSRRLAERGMRLLQLRPGDTVVDLACGTGVNLPYLARAVGPEGRVVGVDLSSEMLAEARDRIAALPGDSVELVHEDVRRFAFPEGVRGVVATFALEMVPEYDDVLRRACGALAPTGGRIAVMGLRRPPSWPDWAVALAIALGRPFGISEAYTQMRPWEAVRHHASEIRFETIALGAVYLSVGQATG